MEKTIFEQIKHVKEDGTEFWKARELYKLLGYAEYSKFIPVIIKARESCKNSKQAASDHFARVSEMIKIASGTEKETFRKIKNFHLTRYACYLIAQNGDPKKEEIALAQTYFALQTRRKVKTVKKIVFYPFFTFILTKE